MLIGLLELAAIEGARSLGRHFLFKGMGSKVAQMGLVAAGRMGTRGAGQFFTKTKYGASLLEAASRRGALGKMAVARMPSTLTPSAMRVAKRSMVMGRSVERMARQLNTWSNLARFYWGATFLGQGASMTAGLLPGMMQKTPDVSLELMSAQQYILPRAAYTQRAKALQAIHQSQLSTRAAIGNEAQYLHR